MNILEEIIEAKKKCLARSKLAIPPAEMQATAADRRPSSESHRLRAALSSDKGVHIIAEIKRASPSRGVIRDDIDPAAVAQSYQAGGAAAISILTEEDHFYGSLNDLLNVRQATSLPLLRKDFIFDEYQLHESVAAGADAVLLIAAALDEQTLAHLRAVAEEELGIDALIEVHTTMEMNRAHRCGATIIGVNNRDLRSFEVSLETSVQLAGVAPDGALLISESGIAIGEDIRRLRDLGYRGFLVGESLMRADDPEAVVRFLISSASANPDLAS